MKLNSLVKVALRVAFAAACLLPVSARAQTERTITLDPPTGLDLQAHAVDSRGNPLPPAPANFRRLGEATVGRPSDVRTVTLRFSQTTRITGLSVSNDFKIEPGGSCVEGNVYERGSTCGLRLRFTPQGPGTRLGQLTVTHSASATPDAFGLGGTSYMPVLSFIPSIISTVPGTDPSNQGLFSGGAVNLTVDGADTLFVADTGNNVIRKVDSSGTIATIASELATPVGIAVDNYGQVYFSETVDNAVYVVTLDDSVIRLNGGGTDSCIASAPCLFSQEAVNTPGQMSMDKNNNLFFSNNVIGAAISTVQPTPATFANIYNPFTNQDAAFAVDSADNLYALWHSPSAFTPNCAIVSMTLNDAEHAVTRFTNVVGTATCGFSGDGGQAGNAEIESNVGQITFDSGGNMYFTDYLNERVRRVDSSTGIIRTIAGNGTAGYAGDGGTATGAELYLPTGVTVDSQGQVYILSGSGQPPAQVIRKVGKTGLRGFPNQAKATHSSPFTVVVTNTGNAEMTLANSGINGANPGDFSIDPLSTSCVLTPGTTWNAGQSCQIGFVFTPSATGLRTANFVLLDNTVSGLNTISLSGTGITPTAVFKITSPSSQANFNFGAPISFQVSVTSGSGPVPTGMVQFKVDGTALGLPVTITSGSASTTVSGLAVGAHTLSATYNGDANYPAVGPVSVSITVNSTNTPHKPTVVMSPIVKTDMSCGPQMFDVTVSSDTGFVPTGRVQLLDGSRKVSSAVLANGKAVLNSPPLSAGTHSFTTQYEGDARDLAGVSAAVVEKISRSSHCSEAVDWVGLR